MSSVLPRTATGTKRDPSSERQVSHVYPIPPPRKIPLPGFYPTERTSTASFKAPVTMPKKKPEEQAPPPNTLFTAMGYLSSPVKYFSSMFVTPPAPEPVKVKERQFKIDLEKGKDKEKIKERELSPRQSISSKKLLHVAPEETLAPPPKNAMPPKYAMPPEKKESPWRRMNLRDITLAPPSPKPKNQSNSPKRPIQPTVQASDPSPTHVSHLKIASSSAQNSFKVMSKYPPEEPERKKKKDPRRIPPGRIAKEVPSLTTCNKASHRNSQSMPTRYMPMPPKEEFPTLSDPTVLPPRIPPPTYTIRSLNTRRMAEKKAPKEPNLLPGTQPTLDANAGQEDILANIAPSLGSPFNVGASSSVDEEIKVEETHGLTEDTDGPTINRLDQPPAGKVDVAPGAPSLSALFPGTTLVNSESKNLNDNLGLTSDNVGALDVVLCAASHYPNMDGIAVKVSDSKRKATRALQMNRFPDAREQYSRPSRKTPSPVTSPPDAKIPPPSTSPQPLRSPAFAYKPKDTKRSPQIPETPKYLSQPPREEQKSPKDIGPKVPQHNRGSPQSTRGVQRKQSPLRVDDKYKAAVEKSLGKPIEAKKPRMAGFKAPSTKPDSAQQHTPSDAIIHMPNIIKKPKPGSKPSSPEKTTSPKSLNTAAAAAAAAVAAAAATVATKTTSVQQHTEDHSRPSGLEDHSQAGGKSSHSPPTSWKMDQNGVKRLKTPSPKQPSPKPPQEDAINTMHAADDVKSHSPSSRTIKDLVRKRFMPYGNRGPQAAAQDATSSEAIKDTLDTLDICLVEDGEELNCMDNYCGDPSKFFKAATMMGELP